MIRDDEKGWAYKNVNFRNTEELAALLSQIEMTVHAKNLIAGVESGFLWCLAEAIQSVSELSRREADDTEQHGLHGDAHNAGLLVDEAGRGHYLRFLRKAFAAAK